MPRVDIPFTCSWRSHLRKTAAALPQNSFSKMTLTTLGTKASAVLNNVILFKDYTSLTSPLTLCIPCLYNVPFRVAIDLR